MSTATKRPLAEARADAQDFRDLFTGCYEQWTVAGSVRRGKDQCGDVDHVVEPKIGFGVTVSGLFGAYESLGNLLWAKCDELLEAGTIAKQLVDVHRADGSVIQQTRWGDVMRCIDFCGCQHQIFTADAQNFGSQLVIRTGPAEFSERMVTLLHSRGLEHSGGRIKYKRNGAIYATPTEEAFFAAAGLSYVEPEER